MVYPESTDAVTPLQEVIKQAIPAAFVDLNGSEVLTPNGSVTALDAAAVVLPGAFAVVHLQLGNVTLSSGGQNVDVGYLPEALRPRIYFAQIAGWNNVGHVSGLASSTSGAVSVRWSSSAISGRGVALSGSWPV